MKYNVVATKTAWDLIGWDNGPIRIAGGRTVYEAVLYNDHNGGHLVKIARLETVARDNGKACVREVSRYVEPDTLIDILE
jgi:hypothetical protein